jgi:hypothetical protein
MTQKIAGALPRKKTRPQNCERDKTKLYGDIDCLYEQTFSKAASSKPRDLSYERPPPWQIIPCTLFKKNTLPNSNKTKPQKPTINQHYTTKTRPPPFQVTFFLIANRL